MKQELLLKIRTLCVFITFFIPLSSLAVESDWGTATVSVGKTQSLTMEAATMGMTRLSTVTVDSWNWYSSNTNVVKVKSSVLYGCTIEGVSAGKARVYCKLKYTIKGVAYSPSYTIEGYFTVTVSGGSVPIPPDPCELTRISLEVTTLTLEVGQVGNIYATVYPSCASTNVLQWRSSNRDVAFVGGVQVNDVYDGTHGQIWANAVGTCTAICEIFGGSIQAICTIKVVPASPKKVTRISIDESISIKVGNTRKMTAYIYPSDAANKSVTWSSSNTNVATINSNGELEAKNRGKTTVTCEANDGSGVKDTCEVTVFSVTDCSFFTAKTVEGTELKFWVDLVSSGVCRLEGPTDKSISGKITIPEEVEGLKVTEIRDYAFEDCSNITEVIIPNSVVTIGRRAFYNCTSLTSITIPNSVTSIEDRMFYGCSGLTSLTIPSSVTSISYSAFRYCSGLTSITIPSSVTSIGNYAFESCSGLTSITIPSSVTSIGNYAFRYCTALKKVDLGNGVKSLGSYCFSGCTSLSTVTGYDCLESIDLNALGNSTDDLIPWISNMPNGPIYIGKVLFLYKGLMPDNTFINVKEGTTQIGYRCFADSKGLIGIAFPKSVINIGSQIFLGCSNLSSITVALGNSQYDSRNNCNAVIDKAQNVLVAGCKTTTIPNTVTAIGDYAFYQCELTDVVIPDNVEEIANHAFAFCPLLNTIVIGKGVKKIEDEILLGCNNLKSISVVSANLYYDSRNNCNAIIETSTSKLVAACTTTVIPTSVKEIDDWVFYALDNICSIEIPASVDKIGEYAFAYMDKLRTISIGRNAKVLCNNSFTGSNNLRAIHSFIISPEGIDESVFRSSYTGHPDSIYNSATLYVPIGTKMKYQITEGWKKFKKIVEVADDATIEGTIFTANTIEGIELTFVVTDVNKKTCELIASPTTIKGKVTIPSNPNGYTVTGIGQYTFNSSNDERQITEVSIPESVVYLSNYALYNSYKMMNVITLPSSLTTIGNYALEYCSMTSIKIPKATTKIGNGALYGCNNLKTISVEVGNSVYESPNGSNAIIEKDSQKLVAGCKSTQIPESTIVIGDHAFSGLDEIIRITIPKSVKKIEKSAFSNCKNLKEVTSLIEDPFEIDSMVFCNYLGYSNGKNVYKFTDATLYVPIGKKTKYQQTAGWKNFKNIVEFDPTGINNIRVDSEKDPIFSLSGQRLATPKKGINIIGKKKVVVK